MFCIPILYAVLSMWCKWMNELFSCIVVGSAMKTCCRWDREPSRSLSVVRRASCRSSCHGSGSANSTHSQSPDRSPTMTFSVSTEASQIYLLIYIISYMKYSTDIFKNNSKIFYSVFWAILCWNFAVGFLHYYVYSLLTANIVECIVVIITSAKVKRLRTLYSCLSQCFVSSITQKYAQALSIAQVGSD